jgi:ABC-2 type transport system permease protein
MKIDHFFYCFSGIIQREMLRFLQQKGRFFAALVRPLVWLFIFAAGFRSILGVSIIPPYETYILYEVYITPGLLGMIILFNGMQTSLSMVYDREMGSMKTLLITDLSISPHCLVLGGRSPTVWLSFDYTSPTIEWNDARCARLADFIFH